MRLNVTSACKTLIAISGLMLLSGSTRAIHAIEVATSKRIEAFTFESNGKNIKAKIFIPASFEINKDLPAIYLIDFTEQHFKVATDEFEKVIDAVNEIQGLEALVITLEEHLDVETTPASFQEFYTTFKDLSLYVDNNYSNNTSRTFIGRGSEAGIVLMALLSESSGSPVFENFIATDSSPVFNSAVIDMIESGDLSNHTLKKKLHFSYSTSNDQEKCKQLINAINRAQFPWLDFKAVEYSTSNYENTYPTSFAAGIKYIFEK